MHWHIDLSASMFSPIVLYEGSRVLSSTPAVAPAAMYACQVNSNILALSLCDGLAACFAARCIQVLVTSKLLGLLF